jgi:hypothetical protein
MNKFNASLLAITFSLVVIVAGLSQALLKYAPYAPATRTEQQTDSRPPTPPSDQEGAPNQSASALPTIGGPSSSRKDYTKAHEAEEQGTEFWPAFLGYRLKVTDTLVAVFTALLFFATRDLVRGADDAARRQLRAYLSMTPKIFSNFVTGGFVQVEFLQRNHGHTPAFTITHIFEIAILPNPLPDRFVFPIPTKTVPNNHTIFPADDAKGWFYGGGPLTAAEVASVAARTHRIHVWGVTTYRDAFHKERTTKFSASAGGQNFVQSQLLAQSGNFNGPHWNWEYGTEHNQAT